MVTKVMIDLDGKRDAVIRISNIREWDSDSDVKDKLVKMFVESLSNRPATLNYEPGGNDAVVRPAALDSILYWLRDYAPLSVDSRDAVQRIIETEFGPVSVA